MEVVLVLVLGFYVFIFKSIVAFFLKNKNSSIFRMHCLRPSEINLFSDNLLKDYRD